MKNLYLLILIMCVGCEQRHSPPLRFLGAAGDSKAGTVDTTFLVCAAAVARLTDDGKPTPGPTPTPDNKVPVPADCPNFCDWNDDGVNDGLLGDGQPRSDCPICDRNGDGDPDDPFSGTPQETKAAYSAAGITEPGVEETEKQAAIESPTVMLIFCCDKNDYISQVIEHPMVAEYVADNFVHRITPPIKGTVARVEIYATTESEKPALVITRTQGGDVLESPDTFINFLRVVLEESRND